MTPNDPRYYDPSFDNSGNPTALKDDTRECLSCITCNRNMIRSGKPWLDEWVDEDERGLPNASETPSGWVCGTVCCSQALYEALGPKQQQALRTLVAHIDDISIALEKLGFRKRSQPTVLAPFIDPVAFTCLYDALFDIDTTLRGTNQSDPPQWVMDATENVGGKQ